MNQKLLTFSASFFALAAIASSASAAIVHFSQASFDSAVAGYTVQTEDFSSILADPPASSFTLSSTTPAITLSIAGGTLDPSDARAGSTALDGAFVGLAPSGSTGFGTLTLSFDKPVEAVSFLLYDLNDTTSSSPLTTISRDSVALWQISGSVGTNQSGTLTEVISKNSVNVGNDVATFFGFTDFGNPFSSIVIENTSGTVDNAAIDNVSIVIPEPSQVGLLLGVGALAWLAIRRRPGKLNTADPR